MSKWIRKDDYVQVITGNDKGKIGVVLMRQKNRVVVQGINIRKKHLKRTQQEQKQQIIEVERSIDISNVRLCNQEGKPLYVKKEVSKTKKDLVYRDGGKKTVYRNLKKIGK
ncbi:MAG: 50S ribosomal protein L24 [Parachlamydiales bacterium]|nr:50S ribosomal protein L24 [Parachlamydiales bacterium]